MTQKEKHLQAMHNFVDRVKTDPNVIALLLWGSLSYYEVWEKSNIEFTMLIRDGSAPASTNYFADEDGYQVNLHLLEVSKFKEEMQKSRAGEFWHSAWGKGTFVYSKDESLEEFFIDARKAGKDDMVLTFIRQIDNMLYGMLKANKWITVYGNALYAQRFLHMSYIPAADMVLLQHGEEPTRESIIRAMELEPEFMHDIFVIPSTTAMTVEGVRHTIQVYEAYLVKHMKWWSRPILHFLGDGEIKTASHISRHSGLGHRFSGIGFRSLDFLAERGIIGRVTQPSRVFKKSKLTVEEVAYFYMKEDNLYV